MEIRICNKKGESFSHHLQFYIFYKNHFPVWVSSPKLGRLAEMDLHIHRESGVLGSTRTPEDGSAAFVHTKVSPPIIHPKLSIYNGVAGAGLAKQDIFRQL